MSHYLVSYDLHNMRTYQPVWNQLEAWGAVRLLESMWLLSTSSTASQVRDALQTVTDSDDSIAVLELKPGSNWATIRTKPEGVAWLRKNISP